MKAKSSSVEVLERFLADSAPLGTVKTLRSDNGTEFVNRAFDEVLVKNRIKHEKCSP